MQIEDETEISRAIVDPDLYEQDPAVVNYADFMLIDGGLQHVDRVVHLHATHIEELSVIATPMQSHDWH